MSLRYLPYTSSALPRTAQPRIEQLINAQTASAYDAVQDFGAADPLSLAAVQARLLEARAVGLLDQGVVTALENAVHDAHEHTLLLADAIRVTATLTGFTCFERT